MISLKTIQIMQYCIQYCNTALKSLQPRAVFAHRISFYHFLEIFNGFYMMFFFCFYSLILENKFVIGK